MFNILESHNNVKFETLHEIVPISKSGNSRPYWGSHILPLSPLTLFICVWRVWKGFYAVFRCSLLYKIPVNTYIYILIHNLFIS